MLLTLPHTIHQRAVRVRLEPSTHTIAHAAARRCAARCCSAPPPLPHTPSNNARFVCVLRVRLDRNSDGKIGSKCTRRCTLLCFTVLLCPLPHAIQQRAFCVRCVGSLASHCVGSLLPTQWAVKEIPTETPIERSALRRHAPAHR